MAVSAAAVAKAAAMLLTNEKTRKGLGWILVAIFSPVILLIALLCSLGSGGAEHNNYSVEACFYGAEFSAEVPAEFRYHIEEMRSAFSLLDLGTTPRPHGRRTASWSASTPPKPEHEP